MTHPVAKTTRVPDDSDAHYGYCGLPDLPFD